MLERTWMTVAAFDASAALTFALTSSPSSMVTTCGAEGLAPMP